MDFHDEFRKSLEKHKSLEGLIFVDPDGEAILFEGPIAEPFHLQLAGAKMPILMTQYCGPNISPPKTMEIGFGEYYIISVRLEEDYSITAIGNDRTLKRRIHEHLLELAVKFNQEIV